MEPSGTEFEFDKVFQHKLHFNRLKLFGLVLYQVIHLCSPKKRKKMRKKKNIKSSKLGRYKWNTFFNWMKCIRREMLDRRRKIKVQRRMSWNSPRYQNVCVVWILLERKGTLRSSLKWMGRKRKSSKVIYVHRPRPRALFQVMIFIVLFSSVITNWVFF